MTRRSDTSAYQSKQKQKGQMDMKKMEQGSPGMERAMRSLEQARARYE